MENLRPEGVVGEKQDGGFIVNEVRQPIPDTHRRRVVVVPMTTIPARTQILTAAVRVTAPVDQRCLTLDTKREKEVVLNDRYLWTL